MTLFQQTKQFELAFKKELRLFYQRWNRALITGEVSMPRLLASSHDFQKLENAFKQLKETAKAADKIRHVELPEKKQ